MKVLTLATTSFLFLAPSAFAADLDGPVYGERDTYVERSSPPVVVRERIIEHHYYPAAPVETYRVPEAYAPPLYAYRDGYYDEPYRYRSTAYLVARPFWRGHHRRW